MFVTGITVVCAITGVAHITVGAIGTGLGFLMMAIAGLLTAICVRPVTTDTCATNASKGGDNK